MASQSEFAIVEFSELSYSLPEVMALRNIVGFEVTPDTPSSSTSRLKLPFSTNLRSRKSSQTDCPHSLRRFSGFTLAIPVACDLFLCRFDDVFNGDSEMAIDVLVGAGRTKS